MYSRKKVRYRRDGYCWKKRKDGKTTREDHMKLKVQGVEVSIYLKRVGFVFTYFPYPKDNIIITQIFINREKISRRRVKFRNRASTGQENIFRTELNMKQISHITEIFVHSKNQDSSCNTNEYILVWRKILIRGDCGCYTNVQWYLSKRGDSRGGHLQRTEEKEEDRYKLGKSWKIFFFFFCQRVYCSNYVRTQNYRFQFGLETLQK